MNQLANLPPAPSELRKPTPIPPIPDYNARVLAYLMFSVMIMAGILDNHFDEVLIGLISTALLWPHVLYFILRYLKQHKNYRIRQMLLYMDGFWTATIIVLLDFSLAPSMSLLIMLNFSLIIVGGMWTWLYGNLAFLAGFTVSSLVFDWEFAPAAPMSLAIVSGLCCTIYVCVTAFYVNQQARMLVRAKTQNQIQREQSIALSHKLAKYLSPQVWQSIFTGERDVRLETQRKKLAVFFSDIRGFTDLTEELAPETLTEVLNTYFNEMSNIVLRFGGTLDKFVGDSIMVFFGDPTSQGEAADTLACVSMAIEMRKHMKVLRQKWKSTGIRTPLEIRMGISAGYCTVGNFGAENRMDYTIIGKEVNLAARLERLAEPGEILVSLETFSLIKQKILCRDKGSIEVKGFARPVPIYAVVDFRGDIRDSDRSFIEHETDGFAMYMDTLKISTSARSEIVQKLQAAIDRLSRD